jgi:hypothetical protein
MMGKERAGATERDLAAVHALECLLRVLAGHILDVAVPFAKVDTAIHHEPHLLQLTESERGGQEAARWEDRVRPAAEDRRNEPVWWQSG